MPEIDFEDLARKASDLLGFPVHGFTVRYALSAHACAMTETLVDLLATKIATYGKAGRRGLRRDEIEELKIVLAVRAVVPGVALKDEIEINTRRWATREAPTFTVSLDCLASILKEKPTLIDPEKVPLLMATLCRSAGGDGCLVMSEAARYEIEAGVYVPDEE